MKRLLLVIVCLSASAFARDRVSGFCQQGGQQVTIGSFGTSAAYFQQSYPLATVTVYLTGTQTTATIYGDNLGTPKTNPFTTASNGYFFFYPDAGRYDVQCVLSGTTVSYGDIRSGLSFAAGESLPFAESAAPSGLAGSDLLWGDSATHRLKMNNNNAGAVQVVGSGVDINTSDQVTATHIASSTNNTLAKFNATGNLVNSGVTDDGTTVATQEVVTLPRLNSRVLVDGTKYATTATGIQNAINDAQAAGSREVWLPCGTINISTTLTITHGGFKLKGCGAGFTDAGSTPATVLVWTGTGGQTTDLLQITGTSVNRLDRVVLEDLILDCAGTCRYGLRAEKVDEAELHGVRIRGGGSTSIGMYTVDATGWKLYNAWFSQCSSYCLVSDWGTGGFYWAGGGVDVLLANTNPAVLAQGSITSWHLTGLEMDSPAGLAFTGFIQVTAFDGNSSFASAPTGGSGSPTEVTVTDSTFITKAASGAASQGADVVITGTAANKTQSAVLDRLYFGGLSISPAAVKFDYVTQSRLLNSYSTGHTASTLITTSNTGTPGMAFVVSGDTVRCTGANCGILLDLTVDAAAGRLASLSGFVPSAAGGGFLGSRLLPFSDVFIGAAATNNIDLTGTATSAKTATLPDNTGTLSELNLAQSWTAQQYFTSNVFFVTADFTTANNTNLQAITGLSWTMPANKALNMPFTCDLLYSQATAAVADQFGIQDVTIAPTNLAAKGDVAISASATTYGNLPALTTTTATAFVTFTPSATTTVFNARLSGFIEQPSNASTSVVQLMVQTSNGADAVTVKRGSWCSIF